MKRLVFLCVALCTFQMVFAQQKKNTEELNVLAKVDPRVELLSIVARLANVSGYTNNTFKLYLDDVNKHFLKDSTHPAVIYLKELRDKNQLGFDAIMQMAVYLNYPSLAPKVPFTSKTPDERWTKEGAEKFLLLLKQFHKETDFDNFFQTHKAMYTIAESRFQSLLNKADLGWFKRFYGYLPKGNFNVYIGLLNGTMSYGPKVEYNDGGEEFYAIIANYKMDNDGMPVFEESLLSTVIHEFNHSFINNLVIKDSAALKPAASIIFSGVKAQMARSFYNNWKTTLYESLVRAAVIKYLIEHDSTGVKVQSALKDEYILGFYWIEDLVLLLGVYEKNRNQYPSIAHFMPKIKTYLDDLATNLNYKYKAYQDKLPKLLIALPIANGAIDVDPTIKEITFIFNQPMIRSWSFNWTVSGGSEHFPVHGQGKWDETRTQLTMPVNLKSNWNYEMILTSLNFRTAAGVPLEPLIFSFNTK